MNKPYRIIISRTDSIGDVVLTLPVAGLLKLHFPECKIIFLGKKYTGPVINGCGNIDEFIDWQSVPQEKKIQFLKELNADVIIHVFPEKDIAKTACKAGIPVRIGTSHRYYNWLYCNKKVNFTRKRSELHEAQLNVKLLAPLGISANLSKQNIPDLYQLNNVEPLKDDFKTLFSQDKFNLILHPKSRGSAREWGVENYIRLIELLPADKYKIFITGTKDEETSLEDIFKRNSSGKITNMMGKLSLEELISFINEADGLVACSTGPLHIAAALGKNVIGIYPPVKPMHPGRWAPLGKKARYVVKDIKCNKCKKSSDCSCIKSISPEEIIALLENF